MKYEEFLVSRIFVSNPFGSWDKLKEAISEANAIDEIENWRDRKRAFNELAELVPMRDSLGYCLKYSEVPEFIESECKAFYAV